MRAPRILMAVALVGSAVLITSTPAAANQANGGSDSSGLTAGASAGDSGGGSPSTSGATTPGGGGVVTCTANDGSVGPVNYRPVDPGLLTQAQTDRVAAQGGGYYVKYCGDQFADIIISTGSVGTYFPPRAPGGPAADPAALARQALQHTPLPRPTITMTPPANTVLVNAPLWLSIDPAQWAARTASASVGAVTSTVVAVPQKVVWDMGDGGRVTCDGPGTAYDPSLDYFAQLPPPCGYVYRASSAGEPGDVVAVTATVYYHATWSATGAPGGGDLGSVSAASTPVSVAVNEIQTVVIPGARP